jgi:hypothetical protein
MLVKNAISDLNGSLDGELLVLPNKSNLLLFSSISIEDKDSECKTIIVLVYYHTIIAHVLTCFKRK